MTTPGNENGPARPGISSLGRWTIPMFVMLVVLVAVVIGQSIILARMSDSITGFSNTRATKENASAQENPAGPANQPDPQSGDKDQRPSGQGMMDDWFKQPFDSQTWDPFLEMQQMQDAMNSMFDHSFGRFDHSPRFGSLARKHAFSPRIDVSEKSDRFVVRVDLPGVKEPSVNVAVDDDRILKISGAREEDVEKSDDKGHVVRQERRLGKFERTITLPAPVDAGKMKVDHTEGVLTIVLPKKKP
jgi:HSP20 family molecular chaperone IbpA